MNRVHSWIKVLSTWCVGLLCALSLGQAGAGPAAFTTINVPPDLPPVCLNGNPNVNCNIYLDKNFVWLNGGPATADLGGNGTFFFAVLDPGAQNDPNDGSAGNLSCGSPCNDLYTNRTFTVTNGTLAYTGDGSSTPHDFDNNKIRLMPYNDTLNPGGVYILAICSLADGVPVNPSNCKYDAFKVQAQQSTGAMVSACKFNDQNNNGFQDSGEPIIVGWPITAFNVDGADPVLGLTQYTDDTGCTTFTVSNPPASVIVQEGRLGAGWTETAPNLTAAYLATLPSNVTVDSLGPKATPYEFIVTVQSGTTTEVDFGNFNPLCANVGACEEAPGLDISKTASNTTTWTITKSVDKTLIEQSGGTATFTYTINAGFTLSTTVSGVITISNNSPADISATGLSDTLNNCAFTVGSPATTLVLPVLISAGDHLDVSYTCDLGSAATNSATVTWTDFGGGSETTDPAVAINFINACVTVQDTFNGGAATTLGTACNTSLTNPVVFTDQKTVNLPAPGTCKEYDNTATIKETGQTAGQTVNVCNTKTGALTMGFWQNPNGQGIIKSYCGGTSGTSLYAYLTGFNPFKDLTKTACTDVASYVYNIIKAATCSSPTGTCNAMLKSQMLSTALDVYFSTPSLGGNKIGPYSGLGNNQPAVGGVKIDLAHVCTVTDSGGTGTCSATTRSIVGSFSPPAPANSCMTVSQMLAFSNNTLAGGYAWGTTYVSNSGGVNWYNQKKNPYQVDAKDGFDTINNQIANICP